MMRQTIAIIFTIFLGRVQCQSPIVSEINFSNQVVTNNISEDKYGFLWFGTDKGIVVYNGYEQINVDLPKDNNNVKEISIVNDKVYAGTIKGSVFIIDLERRSILSTIATFTKSPISDIKVVKENIYVSTYGDGMYILNSNLKMTKVNGLFSNDIYDIEYLKSNNSIAIASDRGIDFLSLNNGNEIIKAKNLPDYIIIDQCITADGKLVGATYNGSIFELDPNTFEVITLYENIGKERNVKVICNGNKLIVLSGNKVHEITKSSHFILNIDVSKDKINAIYIDKENNLWLTVGKTKILKTNLYFINFDVKINHQIQSQLYHNNQFYLGTNEGLFITKNLESTTRKLMLEGKSITTIKLINNKIWIGTLSHGLFIYDDVANKISHLDRLAGIDDNTVLDIEKIGDNEVEIATLAGIKKLSIDILNNKSKTYSSNEISLEAYVYDIYKDSNGNIWYGKDQNGVTLSANGKKQDFKTITEGKKNYKLGSVYSIVEGKNGDVFFSTTNAGVVKYNNGKWNLVSNTFSISDPITSLVKISENEILLIAGSIFKVLDVNDLHVLPFQHLKTDHTPNTYLNNYTSVGNDYYFSYNNSIVRFSSNNKPIKKHPLTNIESVFVNLEKVPPQKNNFDQTQNNLQFYYTAGWLSNPSSIVYSYSLEGFDNNWRTTKDRSVSYPHLSPGKYKFKIKSSESEEFNDEPVTTYEFEIKRAFYNSFWFYSLCAIGVIGVIIYFQRRQKNVAVLKAELSKKMIEAELINLKKQLDPHFLFNTLNTLIGLIEVDPHKGVVYTEQLTDFFRYMSEVSTKELIQLENEIEIVKLYREIVGQRFGENLIINLSPNLIENQYDNYLPPLSLQMLIENAIKHNEVSKLNPLIINIYSEDGYIVVTNKKKPKMTKEKSLGIGNHNIQERYKLLNKTLPKIIETETEYKYFLPIIKY